MSFLESKSLSRNASTELPGEFVREIRELLARKLHLAVVAYYPRADHPDIGARFQIADQWSKEVLGKAHVRVGQQHIIGSGPFRSSSVGPPNPRLVSDLTRCHTSELAFDHVRALVGGIVVEHPNLVIAALGRQQRRKAITQQAFSVVIDYDYGCAHRGRTFP